MRIALVIGALVCSVALHAQSNLRNSCLTVEAHHIAATTSEGAMDSMVPSRAGKSATISSVRVSTGPVGPKLISEPPLKISAADFEGNDPGLQHLVVAFTVDQNGKPRNVRLLKPVNPALDSRILSAVRHYRFTPATLNDQKIAMNIEMTVNFEVRQR
jgi:TonB family protein